MQGELMIGSFAVSLLLSIVLRMLYNTFNISNKLKPWIAVLLGIGFAMIALGMTGATLTFIVVVPYITQGFMLGATATGFYEMTKARTG